MRAVVFTALLLSAVLAFVASPAQAMQRCEKLDAHHIKARDVRTFGGSQCAHARVVLAQYFRLVASPRRYPSCAEDRFRIGCAVTRFDCTTKRSDDHPRNELLGRCVTRARGAAIRFLEYDHLPSR